MRQFKFKSFDDYPIHVNLWDDVESPKAVLQLVHGMTEYADCYDEFARFMNSKGYIVFADDHRAHGRTETDKERGRHKGNIFEKTLKDELFFREWLKDIFICKVSYINNTFRLHATVYKNSRICNSNYSSFKSFTNFKSIFHL